MIVVAVVHLAIHWRWVKMMAKRVVNAIRTNGAGLSKGARVNVAINLVVAVSFVLVSVFRGSISCCGRRAAARRSCGT